MIAAKKPTGMRAWRAAPSRSEPRIEAESTTGSVFGIAATRQKPPAAADRVPVSRSSLCSWPGVRRWTCGSTKPGNSVRPAPSTSSQPAGASIAPGSPISAIRPSRTSTSRGASMPARGSSTRAPRDQHVGRARGRAHERVGEQQLVAHAGCGSPRTRPARGGEHLVEDRHAHDDPGGDLLEDQRLRRVDDVAAELDAAIDRPGMHQQLARAKAPAVDLVDGGVLAQRGHVGLLHALVLHAQRVDDVGLARSSSVVRTSTPSASTPRGISVGGPASVTCAPIVWKARMFERATRECRTSPTIQICAPSSEPSRRRSV